jgi:hypothetical protein
MTSPNWKRWKNLEGVFHLTETSEAKRKWDLFEKDCDCRGMGRSSAVR